MATIDVGGNQVELDDDGYLVDLEQWNKEVAEILAKEDDLELTEAHWEVINFLRDYYEKYQIAPMIKSAKTIKKHWDGVLRWFTSRISNGLLEAINGLIQSAKAKARGFRNSRYLITMVYLIAGKLDFKLPAFAPATHRK